ncbi:YiiX/YebB-like N1pC/P60 family cysteine hydrolase [Neisseria perflava]|uniref:YiiX/YebB-like N1pC/P60 family cysteine hydrolase n=1 Tax=Neisseria perflava TaxID=33053 RepID=UPI0020A02394|nr:cell wall-associated NlpC family hydrolase [Neisseria perflava]MCP1771849.1 cell wall-associated NlpC family hydrolase [Neisseria perflava]
MRFGLGCLLNGVEAESGQRLVAECPANRHSAGGRIEVGETDLQAGDILFSSERSIQSLGIRLINRSAVSHSFLYLGDGMIAEAVGSGVQIIPLQQALRHTNLAAVYRYPGLDGQAVFEMNRFARSLAGSPYNFGGIVKQTPYSLTRKVCEVSVVPRQLRHLCLNSLAFVQITPFDSERYSCSQFVIEAFNHAGRPLTKTKPEWVSPSDMLHFREGDVTAVIPEVRLKYVGHLQCTDSLWNSNCSKVAVK